MRLLRVRLGVAMAVLGLVAGACASGDGASVSTTDTTTTSAAATSLVPPTKAPATVSPTTVPPTTTLPPVGEIEPPSRGVWIHLFDDTLKSPAGVEAMLDEVAAGGLDAVFVQVVRRHDAYFDSTYLPPTPDPGLTPGFDVLDAVITGGHARGLQVHAWFVVAPAYHHQYDDLTMPAGHVWLDHGPGSDDSWMTVDVDGVASRDYFDVALPAVRNHVTAIITDIASNYAVDGIHLDYVRYDGARWGYHPESTERFSLDTGRTDHPSPTDRQWVEWRQDQTAALVSSAKEALRAARPGALLSAAVIAGGPGPSATVGGFANTRAAILMFQDWPSWLDDDRLDFVIAMAYTREQTAEHAGWFRQWVTFAGSLADEHPGRVAVGVGAYLNSVDDALTQIDLVIDATGKVAVYSYQQDSSGSARGTVLDRCCRS